MLYCDLVLNGVQAWSGVPCLLGAPINSRAYLGFVGDLLFVDTQGVSDPDYTGLGTRYFLIYVPTDGSANTVVPLTMEPSQQVSVTLGLQDCLLSFYDRDTLTSPTDRAAFVPAIPSRGFQSPAVVVGPPGPQGQPGIPGAPGPAGNTVLYGSGAPANTLGVDGNFYIDEIAYYIYGPKALGVWPAGVALKGPAGLNGYSGVLTADDPPGTPNTWDDEFVSDTGPSGSGMWSWVNQGTATYSVASGSLNINAPALNGDSLRILVKPWSDAGAWTITTKVNLLAQGIVNYTQAGMVLRNSSTGKLVGIILTAYTTYATGMSIQLNNYNSPTSYSSNIFAPGVALQEVYLRLASDGTNLTASYSTDGIAFINFATVTIASWIGTIDGIGLYANSSNSIGNAVTGSFAWIRKNWTAAPATGTLGGSVPAGGTTGQALVKRSSTDYDLMWSNFAFTVAYQVVDAMIPPTSPSALDDEFRTSPLSPAWSLVNWGTLTTYDVNVSRLDALYVVAPASSWNLHAIMKPLPAGDFTVWSRLSLEAHGTGYSLAGLLLSDGLTLTTGNQLSVHVGWNTSWCRQTVQWTGFNYPPNSLLLYPDNHPTQVYVRIRRVGSALYAAWSNNGVDWDEAAVTAVGTMAYVGLFIESYTGGITAATFDFFRYSNSGTAKLGSIRNVYQ